MSRKRTSKKTLMIIAAVILTGIAVSVVFSNRSGQTGSDLIPIRIGWQTPWATQGQLTQVLKNTDLLKDNGLKGEFLGFAFGAPLNEAALAGSVDVIFTADQPAATLLSKSDDWVIIGRLMYNRVSLYVPPGSPIKQVSDLKGKTVGMPFGAAAQRMALREEEKAGLDLTQDVTNVNVGIYEQIPLVSDPSATKWGTVDALAGFDPTPATFEEKGLIRNLHVESVVSVIVMSKKLINGHPDVAERFLQAFKDAYDYYRLHKEQANAWFREDSKLDISDEALALSASVEPNLKAESREGIRIGFNDEDYRIMQEAADFLYANQMMAKPVTMKERVDLSYLSSVR